MTKLYLNTPKNGYHFSEGAIKFIEEQYKAKYMGFWAVRNADGGWTDEPIDIFYQPNPDTSKGHTHYFGMFRRSYGGESKSESRVYITNGESAFAEPITGIRLSDGEVIVSRYRHDYVAKENVMIDGGRDYVRSSVGNSEKFVTITVENGEFVFNKDAKDNEHDPDKRDWEYDGLGNKVWKGTMEKYND